MFFIFIVMILASGIFHAMSQGVHGLCKEGLIEEIIKDTKKLLKDRP